MNVHGQEVKDVVRALNTRCFFAVSLLEEQLYARFKLLVVPSHLFLHHDDDLVIVLHSEESFLER